MSPHTWPALLEDLLDERLDLPVEVINLVLPDTGLEIDSFLAKLSPLKVEGLDDDPRRPPHRHVHTGDRQTTFFILGGSIHFGKGGVYANEFVSRLLRRVTDEKANGNAHLRSGQTNALGLSHEFQHPVGQIAQPGAKTLDRSARPLQDRVGVTHYPQIVQFGQFHGHHTRRIGTE